MLFRQKPSGTYRYLQIVENHRECSKVRQRTLTTVERLEVLQASGQMDALMRSGMCFCEKLSVIDAAERIPGAGATTLTIGSEFYSFGRFWARLGDPGGDSGAAEEVTVRILCGAGHLPDGAASAICLRQ